MRQTTLLDRLEKAEWLTGLTDVLIVCRRQGMDFTRAWAQATRRYPIPGDWPRAHLARVMRDAYHHRGRG